MQQVKTLLNVDSDSLNLLNTGNDETGMSFLIVETSPGYLAVLANGDALPLYHDANHYDVEDLLAGRPIPDVKDTSAVVASNVFQNRTNALIALRKARISSRYTGSAGAFPLVGSDTLKNATSFYRFLSAPVDARYVAGTLAAGTYLTTALDRSLVNSGFGIVGRYALPLALPASIVSEYQLPAGTHVLVGTVAPMFGQAGGGVEIRLPSATKATSVGHPNLSDY